MAIMLNSRVKVYENLFFSVSQLPDSSTILQPAGIAGTGERFAERRLYDRGSSGDNVSTSTPDSVTATVCSH